MEELSWVLTASRNWAPHVRGAGAGDIVLAAEWNSGSISRVSPLTTPFSLPFLMSSPLPLALLHHLSSHYYTI